MASMLYQAAPDAGAAPAAAGKPLGSATGGGTAATLSSASSLAQQLKDLGKKPDASGWTEKAQRGFSVPPLTGALRGLGSATGGSSASSGGSNIFGSKNAQVNIVAASGLHDESVGFKALKAAAGASAPASSPSKILGSNEAAHAGMSQTFDGARGKAPATIGIGAMAQANAALETAPANLKVNDPNLNYKKLPDPPAAPPPSSTGQNMGQQLMMMAATVLIGGLIPGIGGQLAAAMGMTMMENQAANKNAQQQQPGQKLNGPSS